MSDLSQPSSGHSFPSEPPSKGAGLMEGKTDPLAIASLVVGSLALLTGCCCFCIGFPFGLIAIMLGVLSLLRMRRPGVLRGGRELAIAGIVCGAVALLIASAMAGVGLWTGWLDELGWPGGKNTSLFF